MRRAWIPVKTKREVTAQQCTVCGSPYETVCDHVIAVAAGGGTDESNLQSLCRACNYIKRDHRTNEQTAIEVAARGVAHFVRAVWRHETRFLPPYEKPRVEDWAQRNPSQVDLANRMHADFLRRLSTGG